MTQILEKRTRDNRLYTIRCSPLLDLGATVLSVESVTGDQGNMNYGTAIINSSPITFADGTTDPIGTCIQVRISGGVVPPGSFSKSEGKPGLECIVRALFLGSNSPDQMEATVVILLTDTP